ncbi:MAG: DEAD/DEAH box helicase family protein [Rhodobiaceae bacterium]|nr:DEAD/DEAH box helicase family protein [Rhodobiaceae bacterium]MCC0051829.1 DEAD/DEAH box helicase family protein [Rhodobiaceae bacterium]
MAILRSYQTDAIQSVFDYWQAGGGNPLVEMATGTGKSMVVGSLTRRLVEDYGARVLMLVHVRELVAQNFAALLRLWPDAPAGIYSAGLGKRDAHHRITFASIQSVYRKAEQLGPRDVVLVDEAHLVPVAGDGMYRKLLDDLKAINPDVRVAGFTATAYRMDSGRIDSPGGLFDETVYTYGIADGIADGYLSPLVSKAGLAEIDVSKVQKRGGEFVAGQLEAASEQVTAEAVDEMMRLGSDRRQWLVFCAGVSHAYQARDILRSAGISCETVTGETPSGERDGIIRRYKAGQIRCLTNANVLTTGFDAPAVDMIAMLRPTLSTSLYVQMVGRGTRLANGKENALVLDFAGNVRRHGPVDAISVGHRSGGAGDSEGKVDVASVRAKECPDCKELVAINASACKVCGHEWPREEKPKHEGQADATVGILSTEKIGPQQVPVISWSLRRHLKAGSPDSVRVTYIAGLNQYHEYLGFEHSGRFHQRALQFWSAHGGEMPFPRTVAEALERKAELACPATISIQPNRQNRKFTDIVGRSFHRIAEAAE